MKMFLVVYAEDADEGIMDAFRQADFRCYTKMHGVTGEGEESEPKLDTHCWPGRNDVLLLAVPNDDVPRLIDLIAKIKTENPRACLRAFTFPLEECV